MIYLFMLENDFSSSSTLLTLDWIVMALYLTGMLAIGWYYSYKNKTEEDYLLGGRSMNPSAIGISLFATLLSTLSYLSYPAEMIKHGPLIFAGIFAFPFIYYVAGWWLIPRIMQMRVTSAYEILEQKLGLSVRMLAVFMFLSLRFLWMATVIYMTVEIAILSVIPLDRSYIPFIGAFLMTITIVYTVMGGLKAVVVTDVVQSIVFMGGALICIGVVCYQLGSISAIFPDHWLDTWAAPRMGFDAQERLTFGNAVLVLFVWYICTTGSDQMAVQRYLSTRDIYAARKSLRVSLMSDMLSKILLALVGLAVLSFFVNNPDLVSQGKSLYEEADVLFPRFILAALPAGLSGLIIAGLLSAAMSSLSSGLNSVSAVISEDILKRFKKNSSTTIDSLKNIRMLSLLTGCLTIVLSVFIGNVEGNLIDVVMKVVNLFVAPLFVLFFMALFVPFATSRGTFWGGIVSIATAVSIAFFGLYTISVLWIMPVSLVIGILAGCLGSFFSKLLKP